MTDLIQVFSKLVDTHGKIQIPGIYDAVAELTEKEKALYKDIDFTLEELQDATGSKTNIKDTIAETLMARWRYRTCHVICANDSLSFTAWNRRSLFSSCKWINNKLTIGCQDCHSC